MGKRRRTCSTQTLESSSQEASHSTGDSSGTFFTDLHHRPNPDRTRSIWWTWSTQRSGRTLMKIWIESFRLPRAGGQLSTTGVRDEPMCGKHGTMAGICQDTTLLCPKADTVTPPQRASQGLRVGKEPEMAIHRPVIPLVKKEAVGPEEKAPFLHHVMTRHSPALY